MPRISVLCLTALMFVACTPQPTPTASDPTLEKTITALANEMAENASARNVEGNLRLIPKTDKVVYVSDGAPVACTRPATRCLSSTSEMWAGG